MNEQKSYVVFMERPSAFKTKVWQVESTSGSYLGAVKWFGRWRCYCFFPVVDSVFNGGCLDDIRRFCETADLRRHLRRGRLHAPLSWLLACYREMSLSMRFAYWTHQ